MTHVTITPEDLPDNVREIYENIPESQRSQFSNSLPMAMDAIKHAIDVAGPWIIDHPAEMWMAAEAAQQKYDELKSNEPSSHNQDQG